MHFDAGFPCWSRPVIRMNCLLCATVQTDGKAASGMYAVMVVTRLKGSGSDSTVGQATIQGLKRPKGHDTPVPWKNRRSTWSCHHMGRPTADINVQEKAGQHQYHRLLFYFPGIAPPYSSQGDSSCMVILNQNRVLLQGQCLFWL